MGTEEGTPVRVHVFHSRRYGKTEAMRQMTEEAMRPYGDMVIKLLDETEREDPAIRERLGERERGWWDAGQRPRSWTAWHGYHLWTLGDAEIRFGDDPAAGTVFTETTAYEPDDWFGHGTESRP